MNYRNWHTRVAVAVFDGVLILLILNLVLFLIVVVRQPPKPCAQQPSFNPDSLSLAYPGWQQPSRAAAPDNARVSKETSEE